MFQIENMLTKNNLVYGAMTIFGYMVILLFPINLLFVYVLSRAHLRSHENNDILESIQRELNNLYEFSQHTCYKTAKFVKQKIAEFKNRKNGEFSEFVSLGNMNRTDHSTDSVGDDKQEGNAQENNAQEDNAQEDNAQEGNAQENNANDDNASNEAVSGDHSSGSSDEEQPSEMYGGQAQVVVDGE